MSNPYQTDSSPPPPPYANQGFSSGGQGYQPIHDQGYSPNNGIACPNCMRITESFPKKVAGNVTYAWCVTLFLFTGLLCCIPFCVSGCQDTLMVCVICQRGKSRIKANCC